MPESARHRSFPPRDRGRTALLTLALGLVAVVLTVGAFSWVADGATPRSTDSRPAP